MKRGGVQAACRDCLYWVPTIPVEHMDMGFCHAVPPTLIQGNWPMTGWPRTLSTDWCKEFNPPVELQERAYYEQEAKLEQLRQERASQ